MAQLTELRHNSQIMPKQIPQDELDAIRWIARESGERISVEDRARFIEVVETELSSLHEGNIARYRLRPSEFEAWYKNWK